MIVQIDIPDVITEQYPSSIELKQEIFEDIIVGEFQKGLLTIRESANLLNKNYEGFLHLLAKRHVPFITASQSELQQSYQEFELFMHHYNKQ